METLGTGAGQIKLIFQIASVRYLQIAFPANVDISKWTFEFFVKKNKGDRLRIFTLTIGAGITFVTYSQAILLTFTGAQMTIEEGDYVWELRRTDLNVPLFNGVATFTYDAPQ